MVDNQFLNTFVNADRKRILRFRLRKTMGLDVVGPDRLYVHDACKQSVLLHMCMKQTTCATKKHSMRRTGGGTHGSCANKKNAVQNTV